MLYPSRVVTAYSYALSFFADHLQQLSESNGKAITRQQRVTYPTGPLLVSGEGTNVQHFFQLIHQGPDKIPVEFLKVRKFLLKQL